jgi:peptide/nickel transport system ATP-binding protein
MTEVLAIEGLHVSIGMLPILRDVSLTVQAGEVHGLVGESGAGKSMAGRAVLDLLPRAARIDSGAIRFTGRDLLTMPPRERRSLLGRDMAMIPQDPMASLNPGRRIAGQMTDGMRLHLGLTRKAAIARAVELLAEVQIRDPERVLRQYPHELSGGMRQRVLIAIAFACQPEFIIADEPTTALDVTVQRQILRLIKALQRTARTALLFVTHDLGVVAKVCDRVSVMHSGRILESAPVEALFAAPRHDYTRALFAATPRYDRPASALRPVPAALTERLLAEAAAYDREQARG